jgi:hypothetical protein
MITLISIAAYLIIGFLIGNFGKGSDESVRNQRVNIAVGTLAWPLVLIGVLGAVIIFGLGNIL